MREDAHRHPDNSVKEKLRQMKVNVDTLTMSATPIPRTLSLIVFGDLDIASKRAIREADEFIRSYNSTIEDSTPEQQGGETDEQ